MARMRLERPSSPDGDPDAQRQLCRGMERGPTLSPPLLAHLAARTERVDGEVLSAIGRGIDQIVVLGAGYDDRALRFRTPGVRFFELDHPSTQSDKERRLGGPAVDGIDLTLAPVDFRVDDVAAVLAGCGHAGDRPSLFIAEGLLVYLDPDTIVGLLTGVRSRASGAAAVVVTLAVHPEGIGSRVVVDAANARRAEATAEPWRTILPVDEHLDLVTRAGWSVTEVVDDAVLGTGATPGRSLTVVARPGPGRPGAGPP